MTARSHEDYQENIGAYVLGALPDLEAEVFEKHMAGCEHCRAEVEDLRVVTNAMARSVPQVEPPASLKASLMAVVESEAEVRDDSRARAPRARRRWTWVPSFELPRFAAATALAVLAVGVVLGVAADRMSDRNERTISAKINRTLMRSGNAKLRVSGNERTARLRLSDAPNPEAGYLYELWIQRNGKITPGPVVRAGGDGEVTIPGGVQGAEAVMVTLEKQKVDKPAGPVIMTFDV